MLSQDPFTLLDGKLPTPVKLTLNEMKQLIKKISSNINRISSSITEKDKIISVKVFHYNEGLLAEYKTTPEIIIDQDGTIRHVIKGIYIYSGMPPHITIYIEKENSGIRCVDLNIFGINKKIWGFEEEIKEIIESIEVIKQVREAIINRLKLDGINVYNM